MSLSPTPKTLVLCFDGSSNEYDADNTNVVKFFSLLKKDDFNEQLTYYQPGVGTYFAPGLISPFFAWVARLADLAVAWYLDAHVMGGYNFVQNNYRVGDKICIFGFSRGAYTARALAGMLFKVGLLPKDNTEQIPFAYKLYKRTDAEGEKLSAGFKQTYCQDVKVEFLGVWDTVASVGVVSGRTLPFTDSNTAIKTFRHALSLDERRARFRPSLYHRASPAQAAAVHTPEATDATAVGTGSSSLFNLFHSHYKGKDPEPPTKDQEEAAAADPGGVLREDAVETDLLEVWFAGDHCDVGGGHDKDVEKVSLAHIPLRWMVRQVITSNCGIQFDETAFTRAGLPELKAFSSSSIVKASEQEKALNALDALAKQNDSLKKKWAWYILEIIPLHFSWQDASGKWNVDYGFHNGKGRDIAREGKRPNFHVSVKQRMEAKGLNYKPKAKYTPKTEKYVE